MQAEELPVFLDIAKDLLKDARVKCYTNVVTVVANKI